MWTVLLPPGVNPIAADKYISTQGNCGHITYTLNYIKPKSI